MKKELVFIFLMSLSIGFVFAVDDPVTFAGCQGSNNPSHITASLPTLVGSVSAGDFSEGDLISIQKIQGTFAGRIYHDKVYFLQSCGNAMAEFLNSANAVVGTVRLNNLKTTPYAVPVGAERMYVYVEDGGAYNDNSGDAAHCSSSYGFRTHPSVDDPCRVTFAISSGSKTCSDFDEGVCGMLDDGNGGIIDCTDTCNSLEDVSRSETYCDPAQPSTLFYDRTDRENSCSVSSGVEINEGMCNEVIVPVGEDCPGSQVCQEGIDGAPAACADSSYINYWASFTSSDPLTSGTLVDSGDIVRIISSAPASSGYTIFRDQDASDIIEQNVMTSYWRAKSGEEGVQFESVDGVSDNYIDVSLTGDDTPMEIAILNPLCGEAYNLTDEIQVALSVFDPDDFVTGTVKENDVVIYSFDNLQGSQILFDHSFDSAGNVQLLVEANNTRNERFRQFVNLMIIDNTSSSRDYYTASCIDSPKNFERFSTRTVPFNAESSNAVVFDGSLNPAYTAITHDLLHYSWTFYHDGELLPGKCIGLGSQKCDGSAATGTESTYRFTRTFSTVDDNSVRLSVSIPAHLQ